MPLSPTMGRLTASTVGGAALFGITGAMIGSDEDASRCRRNNPGDRNGLFGDYCNLTSKNTPPSRSMLFASGPILGGVVAALAVRSCHR